MSLIHSLDRLIMKNLRGVSATPWRTDMMSLSTIFLSGTFINGSYKQNVTNYLVAFYGELDELYEERAALLRELQAETSGLFTISSCIAGHI